MVHQRLTPSRIMLTVTGGVKLLGFDCQLADHDEVLGLRSPMTVANYLAPEAFRGRQSAAFPTSDLFSLGVIIYECLTGELPWQAATPAEVVAARRERPAPRVSAKVLECPVWLDVLVSKLLETKRGIRLATADATRRAIVDAKRKVAEGMGAAQHAWSGKQGALTVDADRREITQLRKKQVTRERDDSPFYERAWFLAACLAVVAAIGAWIMWPKSEDALFAAAKPLMESDSPVDWRQANNQYLDELRERFPDTKYAKELAEFDDRVALNHAIESVKNIDRRGRIPKSDAERLYAEGWRYERFDDLLTAWRKYEEVLKKADVKDINQRALATLARQGIQRIKTTAESPQTPAEVVQRKLDRAAELDDDGQALQSRRLLDDIVANYEGNADVAPLVEQARQRMADLDARGAAGGSAN
jgi:serine/threonine protein kinase